MAGRYIQTGVQAIETGAQYYRQVPIGKRQGVSKIEPGKSRGCQGGCEKRVVWQGLVDQDDWGHEQFLRQRC